MKYPKYNAICNIEYGFPPSDIKFIITGTSSYPIESEDNDIIIGDSEPEPIQHNEAEIVNFSSFAGKDTFIYKVSVGILKKGDMHIKNCINRLFKLNNLSKMEI